jgi:hypothetical protein
VIKSNTTWQLSKAEELFEKIAGLKVSCIPPG